MKHPQLYDYIAVVHQLNKVVALLLSAGAMLVKQKHYQNL